MWKKGGCPYRYRKTKCTCVRLSVCALRRWKLARSHVIPTASPHQEALRNYRDAARSNGVPPQSHYLEWFSLSRRYGGRSGVKLRCKERLASIGSLSHPPFTISLQSYTAKAGGGGSCSRRDLVLFPGSVFTRSQWWQTPQGHVRFRRDSRRYGKNQSFGYKGLFFCCFSA